MSRVCKLYVKAVYYELFGIRLRGHRLRELLGVLIKTLDEHCYTRWAEELLRFVDENKRTLIMIEDAYVMSRYGDMEYSSNDVEKALPVAKKLREILESVCKDVKLG